MKTTKDFTAEEIEKIKSTNFYYYQQIINNSSDLFIEYGSIKDKNTNCDVIGITSEHLQNVISDLKSEKYAYSRYRDYGITIYHYDNESPTGVKAVNGLDKSFMWLVDSITKIGVLSPTEGLCSSR